jgi:putative SOS response-associated peptidase YedK
MCYHSSKAYSIDEIEAYFNAQVQEEIRENWNPYYHENGFDHQLSPVVTAPGSIGYFSWGLIPWYTKELKQAEMIRNQTLNCISEEMYEKPSFRDSANDAKRCLIPMTGFYEWKWQDSKGKEKTPHYVFVKEQKIFSVAGIYSTWKDKSNNSITHSYSVLTTSANQLMEEIHNSKKRMPVIIPREYESDWLNQSLTKEDVIALCKPFDTTKMDAYPISKRITSKKDPTNVPEVMQKVESGLLF